MIIACIPALNEAQTISNIVISALKYVDKVLVCDDGSGDTTVIEARNAGAKVISNPVNLGKGASLKILFNYALKLNADIVVTLDADNQHDPRQIPDLIKPIIEKKADIVIGSRYLKNSNNKAPLYRKFGLMALNFLSNGDKVKVKDTQSGYRAFSRKSIQEMVNIKSRGYGVESEQIKIAYKNGLNITEIPIDIIYKGIYKSSKMNPISQGFEVIKEIMDYSIDEKPMLFCGFPGLILLLIGVSGGFYLIKEYLSFNLINMYTSVITIVGLIAGAFLFIKGFNINTKNKKIEKVKNI
jgi:glycosyltransferase involved in cell wall biosynthesis